MFLLIVGLFSFFFFFNDPPPPKISPLPLPAALPIWKVPAALSLDRASGGRSGEHRQPSRPLRVERADVADVAGEADCAGAAEAAPEPGAHHDRAGARDHHLRQAARP